MLAIVENFRSWQAVTEEPTFVPDSHSPGKGKELALSGSSTQINSAGIIFSSKLEATGDPANEVSTLSISSIHSESALVAHTSAGRDEAAPMDDCAPAHYASVRAASGYMMALQTCDEDLAGDTPAVELPTPKELIVIRQKKKARKLAILSHVLS